MRLVIPPISQAYAHVVMHRVGNANGETESQQALGQAKQVEVAIPAEQRAGDCSPNKSGRSQWQVRQVSYCEQESRRGDCQIARHHAAQPWKEVILQQELLVKRPEHVSADVRKIGLIERVERADILR